MEPEDDFLKNAATMMRYARKELEQFLAWTNKETDYGRTAQAIIQNINAVSTSIGDLQQQYKRRDEK